ncbi:MAG: hybrid sensor histidine kinase/response regulator [Candidatus Krumholzibacteria bacterium]|nr:hybrid sensor histidine kinase/response regulator [Candidatus Krumholzibacteria bacterium]
MAKVEGASLRQAGVVHDVNQMLAVIMGRAELLQQCEGSNSRREDLAAIILAAGDAAAMLKRLQRGLPPPHGHGDQAAVNLREAVRAVSLLIRPEGTERWASPEEESGQGSWIFDLGVPADLFTSVPGQVIREVLSNLLVNALEVLPDGGRIRVDAATDRGRVVLTIADNGPGLDKETAHRIFEPGFTSSGGEFRGIGLAGSRQLLKCFDGRLDLGPDQGTGAQFLLDLPRVEPVPAKSEAEVSKVDGQESRPVSFPVLVVDDEPAVRDMLSDVLTELDCRVTVARDANSALDRFVPEEFGLAMVDQSLPGRSGLELAAVLRERDPYLVVVLITGWGQEETLASVDPAIVDMTATKPLEWTHIIELLDKGERLNRQRRDAGSG